MLDCWVAGLVFVAGLSCWFAGWCWLVVFTLGTELLGLLLVLLVLGLLVTCSVQL